MFKSTTNFKLRAPCSHVYTIKCLQVCHRQWHAGITCRRIRYLMLIPIVNYVIKCFKSNFIITKLRLHNYAIVIDNHVAVKLFLTLDIKALLKTPKDVAQK